MPPPEPSSVELPSDPPCCARVETRLVAMSDMVVEFLKVIKDRDICWQRGRHETYFRDGWLCARLP